MRTILIFCVAMVTIAALSAQQGNAESTEIENALLWEISGNDLTEPSYIYGTMHIGDQRILDFGDSVKTAVNAVDAVYGEVDLTDLAAQMAVMKDMIMLDTTLNELVSEKDYALIQKTLEGTESALLMNQIKPFFTMGNMATMFLPSEDLVMIDVHFLELGKKLGKEVGGIETMQEQVDVVNSLSLKEQAKMLVEMCEDLEEQKKMFQKMYAYYLNEDLTGIAEIANEEMDDMESASFEAELLDKRNVKMVERLAKLMTEKSVFFAVGALHLPGENGLIKLLELEGYKVTAIKS